MALSDAEKLTRVRRFYKRAAAGPAGEAHGVLLDGRPARTAGGAVLAAPTLALAGRLADEWDAQAEFIDFGAMRVELAREVARYAGADTLCYPAEAPLTLALRQDAGWTPWRDWARDALGLRFEVALGSLHLRQPAETLARTEALAGELGPFALTGLVFACGLFGSAILGLAVQRRALGAVDAFELSRVEEAYQAEQWGIDSEAEARTAALRAEAAMLGDWFTALA
jgi:chaperone required for assembly of F1-ATPase